jgi:membrane fusion protein (multidrug efflux system)
VSPEIARPQPGSRTRRGHLATLALALALAACGEGEAAPDPAAGAIPVVARPVGRVERPDYVGLSGDVEAIRMANVGFLVPGVVRAVGPREGQAVAAGELLAELDPTDYELNVEMAAAQRERAEQELARARIIFDQKGIPENDFQKAETGARLARAQEAMARKKLADSRLASPLSGLVARRGIEPGEQAGPGFPVFTIVQMDPVQVKVGVPEADIARFAVGQRAVITIPSLGGATFEGRVRVVGVAADPASRTYTVKAEVPNPGHRLKPGMIAEVRIENDDMIAALTLPGEAVVRDADGVTRVFVYAPEEGRVYERRVEIGAPYGTEIEIRSGLGPDDLVVVGGQHRVREGARVTARVDPAPEPLEASAAR